jgi:23S rRNA (cytosine1962-C5)-methyltransferase
VTIGASVSAPGSIDVLFERALDARAGLLDRLREEGTDCLRLFHGATEGLPGIAVDRYGPVLLAQAWGRSLTDEERTAITALAHQRIDRSLVPAFVRRDERETLAEIDPRLAAPIGHELGLAYDVRPYHRGKDPLLFLDLRVARRWVRAHARGLSVLNLFAYTCGVGVAAGAGGAREVWNVDFARSALEIGRANAERNAIPDTVFRTIEENAIPALRQLAGMPVKGRGAARPYKRLPRRTFDLVVLDPPRWAKTPFGAIDVVRDYPSLIKPSIACVAPGGRLLLTNHVPGVAMEELEQVVRRSADKSSRDLVSLEALVPDDDFPSPDGRHPLKILIASLA